MEEKNFSCQVNYWTR